MFRTVCHALLLPIVVFGHTHAGADSKGKFSKKTELEEAPEEGAVVGEI